MLSFPEDALTRLLRKRDKDKESGEEGENCHVDDRAKANYRAEDN